MTLKELTTHIRIACKSDTQTAVARTLGMNACIINKVANGFDSTDKQAEQVAKKLGVHLDGQHMSYKAAVQILRQEYDALPKLEKMRVKKDGEIQKAAITAMRQNNRMQLTRLVAFAGCMGYKLEVILPVNKKGVKNGFTGWGEPY